MTRIPRRQFLRLTAGAVALPFAPAVARAQTYPSRPVRIVVGFPPAGSTDIAARLIGQWLSERLGQQFVIENRPGAGATLATEAVTKAPPDGYTLLLTPAGDLWNEALYGNLKYNFIRDIVPVAALIRQPQVLAANPSTPARTLPELIAYAKANPGKIMIASAGNGSTAHLSGELLKMMAGINMIHVPYRGAGPALTDLIAGHVQVSFAGTSGTIEYLRSGQLRGLAVTTATRADALPDIPAVSEFVPGYEATSLFGIGAPRNTPAEIVDKLNREVNAGLADSKMRARIEDLGGTPLSLSPAEFGKLIAEETEKWSKVIRAANVKPE